MMKYTIIVELSTDIELIFRVKAENSKEATLKVVNELSDIQWHFVTDIQVKKEPVFREVVYKEL